MKPPSFSLPFPLTICPPLSPATSPSPSCKRQCRPPAIRASCASCATVWLPNVVTRTSLATPGSGKPRGRVRRISVALPPRKGQRICSWQQIVMSSPRRPMRLSAQAPPSVSCSSRQVEPIPRCPEAPSPRVHESLGSDGARSNVCAGEPLEPKQPRAPAYSALSTAPGHANSTEKLMLALLLNAPGVQSVYAVSDLNKWAAD